MGCSQSNCMHLQNLTFHNVSVAGFALLLFGVIVPLYIWQKLLFLQVRSLSHMFKIRGCWIRHTKLHRPTFQDEMSVVPSSFPQSLFLCPLSLSHGIRSTAHQLLPGQAPFSSALISISQDRQSTVGSNHFSNSPRLITMLSFPFLQLLARHLHI